MPGKSRGVEDVAEGVGLPGDRRVPEAGPDEDGLGVREVVTGEVALLHLVRAEDAAVVELVALAGERMVYGFQGKIMGAL